MEPNDNVVTLQAYVEEEVADAIYRAAQEAGVTPEEAAGRLLAEELERHRATSNKNKISFTEIK